MELARPRLYPYSGLSLSLKIYFFDSLFLVDTSQGECLLFYTVDKIAFVRYSKLTLSGILFLPYVLAYLARVGFDYR